MDKTLFKEYADIKAQIAALQLQSDEIAALVAEEMRSNDVDKVESDFGTFYFTTRKTWTYSPAIDAFANELKERKKDEEVSGVATCVETSTLSFRAPKSE